MVNDEWWSDSNHRRQTWPLQAAAFALFLVAARLQAPPQEQGVQAPDAEALPLPLSVQEDADRAAAADRVSVWRRCPTEIWLAVMKLTRNSDFHEHRGKTQEA